MIQVALALLCGAIPGDARFVASGKAEDVSFEGASWKSEGGALAGESLMRAGKKLGPGNFTVRARLAIDGIDKSAAALVLNDSFFGFEGKGDEMFVEGSLFGKKNLGDPVVHEGKPFDLVVRRQGGKLTIEIDGKVAHRTDVDRKLVISVGLRPHRSRMRLFEFSAVGELLALPKPHPHVEVFAAGKDGYSSYRIPAIVLTKKGTLLAFCEGRKDGRGDAGNIDLLVRRSTDLGKSWSASTVIWDDGGNTCGNPCPVVDQDTGVVWLPMTWNLGSDHEGQIMAAKSKHPRHVYVTKSSDDGVTWADPVKISAQTRKDHWRWYATGPGNAIQLTRGPHKGRLLIPANHSDHSDSKKHPYRSHVFWSDDHGKTWELGGVHEDRTNESAVVELVDGSVLQSMRSYHGKHNRAVSVSTDGGKSWGKVRLDDGLPTPVCQANILRYSWPEEKGKGGRSRILFSSPSAKGRSHLAIRMSYDEGKTWPVGRVLHEGGSAYSNLVVLPDGAIGVFYEKDGYKTMSFAVITLEWVGEK